MLKIGLHVRKYKGNSTDHSLINEEVPEDYKPLDQYSATVKS